MARSCGLEACRAGGGTLGPRPPHKAVVDQGNLGLPSLQGGIQCNLGKRAHFGDQRTGANVDSPGEQRVCEPWRSCTKSDQ
eukprot:7967342-Pyramimonas_sp.AAC.1